jgi:hypothetical protein
MLYSRLKNNKERDAEMPSKLGNKAGYSAVKRKDSTRRVGL